MESSYGPCTGTWFESTSQTDIEHIIARSEAHDSGLCAAGAATKRQFASDLLNLTLASPSVNRSQKSGKDAAEWLPDLNQCWFASRVVEVRQRYGPHHRQTRGRRAGSHPVQLHVDHDGRRPLRCAPGRNADANIRGAGPTSMPCGCTTTTGTVASPARRHGVTALRRSAAAIQPIRSWTIGTTTEWCASEEGSPGDGGGICRGSGGGYGFSQDRVPSATDRDGDGIVCEDQG